MKSHRLLLGAALLAASAGASCAGPRPLRSDGDALPSPRPTRDADASAPIDAEAAFALAPNLHDERGRLRLDRALDRVRRANRGVLAARAAADAARSRRAQATALPDPTLVLGWYAEEVQTRTGSQEFAVGLGQRIPWPEKLGVAGEVADLEAEVARVRAWAAVRDAFVETARRFAETRYLDGAAEIAELRIEVWSRLVAHLASGRAANPALSELVRAETELARARYDRLVLLELAAVERQRLRTLLALPPEARLGAPAPLALPELAVEPEDLVERALRGAPEMILAGLEVRAAELGIEGAELRARPDFSVGGRWFLTDPREDADPRGNGRDPVVFELGMTLPLQFGAQAAAVTEASRRAQAAAFRREDLALRLRADVGAAAWRVRDARRLVALHETTLLPAARAAAAAAEALVEEGATGVSGLVETISAHHHLELALLRARADLNQGIAELERLVGAPLARVEEEGR